MSMRDKYLMDEVCIVGLCTPDDITSDYKYLTQVDEVVTTYNDIYMDIDGLVAICKEHQVLFLENPTAVFVYEINDVQ